MTRLEQSGLDPELTLELARLTTEPLSEDKMRNFTALRSRLGLPVVPLPAGSSAPSGSLTGVRVLRGGLVGRTPWKQLIVVGVTTGALGFLLGLRFEVPQSQKQALPAPSATVTAFATQGLSAPAEAAVTQVSKAGAISVALSDVPVLPAARTTSPALTAAPRSTPNRRSRRTKQDGDASASRIANPEPSAAFLEAVQLLARARRALNRGEPMLALGLLDEIDRRFPPEMLDEERAATRVLGLCANGQNDAAVQLASQFFSGRPRSIYTRRIERSCASSALALPTPPTGRER